jgi:inosose dehydratase
MTAQSSKIDATRKSLVNPMNRRSFLVATAAMAVSTSLAKAAGKSASTISFGIGNYGMKTLKAEEALRAIAEIGYDGVELALMPGWATEPKVLSTEARRELRALLDGLGLALPALIESLPMKGTADSRAMNRERLIQAAALSHELAPGKPPVIETILGLKASDWEQAKGRMAEELKDWAKIAEEKNVTICFKPHAANAVQSPERALWLLKEIGPSRIRIVYDYSHMSVEGFGLADSLKQLLPHTAFISVKDSVGTPEKHEFLLPGDGKTDYVEYFRLLKELNYSGFVIVEVSGMIHGKPGYQPVPTAKLCYDRLSVAFEKAGVKRPKRAAV